MTKKDYDLIAMAVWRSNKAKSLIGNKIQRTAALQGIELVAVDLAATLANDNPKFDRLRFLVACGMGKEVRMGNKTYYDPHNLI